MSTFNIKAIEELIASGDVAGAEKELLLFAEGNVDAMFKLGELYYQQQRWGDALNCFRSVLEVDQNNTKATTFVNMINSILGYYNPEMFNP